MELCLTQVTTIAIQVGLYYAMSCKSSNYVIILIRLYNGRDFSITLTLVTVEIHLGYPEKDMQSARYM